MRFLVVFIAALAAVASPVSAASTDAVSGIERRATLEQELVRELNRVRAARSLPHLRPAVGLRRAATEHSRAMLVAGFFDHVSPDGTTFDQRIRRYYSDRGWRRWSVGETLLATSERLDARLMVEKWLESRSHRTIILSGSWREIGIGAHYEPAAPGEFGGLPTTVVTADFGARAGKSVRAQT
jgi:uncharacterized protein YkwD